MPINSTDWVVEICHDKRYGIIIKQKVNASELFYVQVISFCQKLRHEFYGGVLKLSAENTFNSKQLNCILCFQKNLVMSILNMLLKNSLVTPVFKQSIGFINKLPCGMHCGKHTLLMKIWYLTNSSTNKQGGMLWFE